ncbi:MAG: purine-nucleoside phosphorylase [Deltaproteobacteria bacterium]|nr:purine-nucleoside phosphorylase [Deltaproteobacteria bacterium]
MQTNAVYGSLPLRNQLVAAAGAIQDVSRRQHVACVVLGSGFGGWAEQLPGAVEIPISQLPHWPLPSVAGHSGRVFSILVGKNPVLVMAGRVHSYQYDGGGLDRITFATCAAVLHGCRSVFLTNASGSVNLAFKPGDFVLISDHINHSGLSVFSGPVEDESPLFPYFSDQSDIYNQRLREAARQGVQERMGLGLQEGVYAWMRGRTYETPAEIRMLRAMGADQVGMSTVPEAQTAYAMGASVLGLSLITNYGAGIQKGSILSHEEVAEAGRAAMGQFQNIMDVLLPVLVTAATTR